jgi:HAD superfamily hydrolase (TIGR01509 family)
MKEIAALIFDCDGVMFDSKAANIRYYNHLLQHFNLDPLKEDEDIQFVHMHTSDECIRHIFDKTPYVEDALELKGRVGYSTFIKDMKMEPGLKELLQSLRQRCGLAVATNRSDTIDEVMRAFNLETYFDIIVSSLDVQAPKPHPESVFRILGFFGIGPSQALYVGDSEVDALVCRESGVTFIAYKNRDLAAHYHIDDLLQIEEILSHYRLIPPCLPETMP